MKSKLSNFWFEFWAPGLILLVVAVASLYVTGVLAATGENPIGNFYEVFPENKCAPGEGAGPRAAGTIFRGEAPGTQGLEYLKAMGVKTILNFQSSEEIAEEVEAISELNLSLTEIAHPMPGFGVVELPDGEPDHDAIISAVADMRGENKFPEFLHCTHGQDRTGMVVALHRVFNECWAPADAEDEWNRIEGWFHHLFQPGMHDYFNSVVSDPALRNYYAERLKKVSAQR